MSIVTTSGNDDLSKRSKDELLKMIETGLTESVTGIRKAGRAVVELEGREIDVEAAILPKRLLCIDLLRRVGSDQFMPELFSELMGQPALASKLAKLPIEDQRKICDGKPIKVAKIDGDVDDSFEMPVRDMPPKIISQVFGDGKIRSVRAQIQYLRAIKPTYDDTVSVPISRIQIDKKKQRIVVAHKYAIPLAVLEQIVSEMTAKSRAA